MGDRERIAKRVIEALSSFGGETVVNIVSWHLKNTYRVDLSDAICNPEAFTRALNDIYGQFSSFVTERICVAVAEEFGVQYSGGGLIKLSSQINANCE